MATGGSDTSDEVFVMVGEDEENLPINPSDPDKHKATDTENERKEDGMDTNDTTGEPGNPTPQNDMRAGRARHDDMETEPPEPGDAAKYGTGLGGKNPEPGGDSAKRVGIFVTDRDVDINWLIIYISSVCKSWKARFVPLTDDSWRHVADKTSPHIICHSVRSRRHLSDLEHHREHFTHSPVPVKVLVTDVSDPESEEQIKRWMEQHMPRTWELLILYENEMDLIQPERQKPCTDTNTEDKLKRMREILSTAAPSQFHRNRERRKDHTIGIFSRSAEENYSWLQTLLRSDGFRDRVQEVRSCYISSSGFRQFHEDVSQCSFGILYHTKIRGRINVTDVTCALYDDELRYLSDTLGRENVVVVIDDLDDSGPDMRSRILQTQPSIETLSRDLILFSNEEKSDWEKYLPAKQSPDPRKLQEKYLPAKQSPDPRKLQEKLSVIKGWIKPPVVKVSKDEKRSAPPNPPERPEDTPLSNNRNSISGFMESMMYSIHMLHYRIHTVGIFSSSAEEDYSWLQTLLGSDGFSHRVQEVRSCYVSSSGFRQFHQVVSQCSFGILYHSKNRGRVNVTDVTSALYDKELRYLSDTLGKQSVVVLIDDLEDSSSVQKTRILQTQPSIARLARNLILINNQSNKESLISPRELFYERI